MNPRYLRLKENRHPVVTSHDCLKTLRLLRDVRAIVHNGHLAGASTRKEPLAYETLIYCGHPTCEKVFRSDRADAGRAAAIPTYHSYEVELEEAGVPGRYAKAGLS